MNMIMLPAAFILMTGIAVLFCNLLHLNPAEGMILAVFVIIAGDAIAVGLVHNYIAVLIAAVPMSAGGLASAIYRWSKEKKIRFDFLLSPYFIALTSIFVVSMMIYHGDIIQNVDELNLWAMADKYMVMHDKLYIYNGYYYIQGNNLFRYFFLKPSGFNEGNLYAVSGLLYWFGLLLPFGKIKREHSPRILLYILLLHIGLYSMYYYGTKSCGPELPLACWTGGLAGWWITREKKKENVAVLIAGLLVAFSFTSSVDAALVCFVILLVLFESAGLFIRKKFDLEKHNRIEMYYIIAGVVLIPVVCFLIASITRFSYLEENMTYFLRCLVENNMTLGGSDFNYTFIFNAVLFVVLLVVSIDRRYQRRLASRYITYGIVVSILYIAVLIFGVVDGAVHVEEDYLVMIQRLIAVFVIYLFVMALSWMLCEERMLEKKFSYIPGLILLVVFMYGVNDAYITNTSAAYPEKADTYAEIQKVMRQCNYINDSVPSDGKIYMINQGEEIASATAKFVLSDRISDFSSETWQFSVNGGMLKDEIAPYETIHRLPVVLTKGKYGYVWIYKTDEYLNNNLPSIMGDEMESLNPRWDAAKKTDELISGKSMAGGQLYKVLYNKKKARELKLIGNIVSYDTRKTYYRWKNITE